MSKSSQDRNEREKQLRFENELEKLKLMATHGATFFSNDKSNIPPEIEYKWLNYINKLEDQFEYGDSITVRARLGNPEFPSPDELVENEIPEKLDELYELMIKNNVSLDVLGDEPESEIYRFITEELFEEEIDDIQIEGMYTCFIYEDFHPNAKLDAGYTLENFFMHFLNENLQDQLDIYFCEKVQCNNENRLPRDDYLKRLYNFLDSFDKMVLHTLDIKSIDVNNTEDKADISFFVHYSGWFEANEITFEGRSEAHLKRDKDGFWRTYSLSIPPYHFI